MSSWPPPDPGSRPLLHLRQSAPRVVRPDGPLVLHDQGYVEGRRLHVVPAWSVALSEGLDGLVQRLGLDRPECDTIVLAGTGPVLARDAVTLRRGNPDAPQVLLARHCEEAKRAPMRDADTIPVGQAAIEEAALLLSRLPWGPASGAAAVAIAGFWYGAAQMGEDVVVVLADLEPVPPAAAA
ncbi:MAG: hypothetical protein QNJ98_18620 [Planctomycetota bacterium]|nr:hypothetical protein [Planctomycetota bacterium]